MDVTRAKVTVVESGDQQFAAVDVAAKAGAQLTGRMSPEQMENFDLAYSSYSSGKHTFTLNEMFSPELKMSDLMVTCEGNSASRRAYSRFTQVSWSLLSGRDAYVADVDKNGVPDLVLAVLRSGKITRYYVAHDVFADSLCK